MAAYLPQFMMSLRVSTPSNGSVSSKLRVVLSVVAAAGEVALLRGSNFFRGSARNIFTILAVPSRCTSYELLQTVSTLMQPQAHLTHLLLFGRT